MLGSLTLNAQKDITIEMIKDDSIEISDDYKNIIKNDRGFYINPHYFHENSIVFHKDIIWVFKERGLLEMTYRKRGRNVLVKRRYIIDKRYLTIWYGPIKKPLKFKLIKINPEYIITELKIAGQRMRLVLSKI